MTNTIKDDGILRGKNLAMELHRFGLKWAPTGKYSEFMDDLMALIEAASKSLTDYLAS